MTMKQLADTRSEGVYSQRQADRKLAARVQGIQDGGIDCFVSPVFLTEGTQAVFFKAFRYCEGGAWTVQDIRVLDAEGRRDFLITNTAANDLCFFDALYFVAQKAKQYEAFGYGISDDAELAKVMGVVGKPDYRAAAAQAGQPFDMAGLPMPAAGGHLLAGGYMDAQGVAVLEKSQPLAHALTVGERLPALGADTFFALQPVRSVPVGAVVPFEQKLEEIQRFAKFDASINTMMTEFEKVATNEKTSIAGRYDILSGVWGGVDLGLGVFAHVVLVGIGGLGGLAVAVPLIPFGVAGAAALPLAGLGASGLLGTVYYHDSIKLWFPVWRRRMEKRIAQLSDPDQQKLLRDFTDAATGVYYLERAASLVEGYRQNRNKPKYMLKALPLARKGLEAMHADPAAIEATLADMQSGQFPAPGSFLAKLKERADGVRQVIKPLTQIECKI